MVMPPAVSPAARFLPRSEFDRLLVALRANDCQLIGPRHDGDTLELGEIDSAADLPAGIGLQTAPGSARLVERGDGRLFAYPSLAGSWKRLTFPPRARVGEWVVDSDGSIRFQAAAATHHRRGRSSAFERATSPRCRSIAGRLTPATATTYWWRSSAPLPAPPASADRWAPDPN